MCSLFAREEGVLNGPRAQEESRCSRSTLYDSLHDYFYRISEDSAISSPDVLVFRTSDYVDLLKKDRCFLDLISCAALRFPDVVVKDDGTKIYETDSSSEAMTLKVRLIMIMQIAVQMGISHLLLGAFGCGVYGNPPAHVARIFMGVVCGDRRRPGVSRIEEIRCLRRWKKPRTFHDVFQDVLAESQRP